MEPITPVYTAPWATPLPVTTIILSNEEALKALDIALNDERRRRATWFADGSLLEGKVGGAAVRVEGTEDTTSRSGQYRAIQYDALVRWILPSRPHLAILNLWTPAHIGTAGNDLADAAAKEATTLPP
ncbi:reverse transcriptase [Mycena venus]|uniref:Reverse transcriptase n=1 Tax=Mycena venus TaxID=2733690 RepID=A0A8H6Z777_9AGAR|nr:reverse transcriptase [Mycena venus]